MIRIRFSCVGNCHNRLIQWPARNGSDGRLVVGWSILGSRAPLVEEQIGSFISPTFSHIKMFLIFFVNYITIRNFPEEHSDTWSKCGRIRHVVESDTWTNQPCCQIRHVVESDICFKADTWSNQTCVSNQTRGWIRHVCHIRHVCKSDTSKNQTCCQIRHVVESDTWLNQSCGWIRHLIKWYTWLIPTSGQINVVESDTTMQLLVNLIFTLP